MKRFTEKELADRWGLSVRTVQKWRNRGVGPAYIVIGQHTVLYREEDVLSYEASKKQGGEPPPEPEGWRKTLKRASAVLGTVAQWKSAPPEAKKLVLSVRDEINQLLGE